MPSESSDLTLTPADFATLQRVPVEWWEENSVISGISAATGRTLPAVRAVLTRFVRLGLLERRVRHTISPTQEVRRIAKD